MTDGTHGSEATRGAWTWRGWAAAAILYLLLALVLTWPLPAQFGEAMPADHGSGATVPLFNLWTLEWNAHSLRHGYAGYWNAPIFYPDRGVFALSEPLPLPGVVFTALEVVTRSPVAAYDTLLLLALVLNGVAALWVGRQLGLPPIPCLVGGLLGVALPFVLRQLGVLQLSMVFPLLFALGSLHRFSARPDRANAVLLGVSIGITYLCCGYYFVFLTLLLPVAAAIHIRRTLLRPAALGNTALTLLVAAALVLPLATTQAAVIAGYSRTDSSIAGNSARLVDYLELNPGAWGAGIMPWLASGVGTGERLYPGTGLLLLAVAGGIIAWRTGRRRWVATAVTGAALAVAVSLGLHLSVGGAEPYRLLMAFWPGFRTLRNPWRMAVMVQVFALCLAPFAITWLWQRRVAAVRWLGVAAVTLSVLEVMHPPIAICPSPQARLEEAWVQWLHDQPAGAVAMVPFADSPQARAYEPIVTAMLQGLEHGKPLVNGYSGFLPHRYWALRNVMLHFPDTASMTALLATGPSYLVVDRSWLNGVRNRALEGAGLTPLYADLVKVVYGCPERATSPAAATTAARTSSTAS